MTDTMRGWFALLNRIPLEAVDDNMSVLLWQVWHDGFECGQAHGAADVVRMLDRLHGEQEVKGGEG